MVEVSDQLHTPAAFTPGERASHIHWIGGWVGPRTDLDVVVKGTSPIIALPRIEPRSSRP